MVCHSCGSTIGTRPSRGSQRSGWRMNIRGPCGGRFDVRYVNRAAGHCCAAERRSHPPSPAHGHGENGCRDGGKAPVGGGHCCQWWAISASSSPFSSFTRVRALNIAGNMRSERRSARRQQILHRTIVAARACRPAEAAAEMRDQHLRQPYRRPTAPADRCDPAQGDLRHVAAAGRGRYRKVSRERLPRPASASQSASRGTPSY